MRPSRRLHPQYDPASHCSRAKPGMVALQGWLEATVRGVSWGAYRCEKWGKKQASPHAEGRASGTAGIGERG